MADGQQEKLPLDAKLLSDAVIELNISRRSVGMYPPEHPIVRQAIDRALQHLLKLFEIRPGITLGIAKDALIIDEYTLDRRNPVFREFAKFLHAKGIAAITFTLGLNQTEMLRFHEIITSQDGPSGKELAELAGRDMVHISFSPIDLSKFFFVEGMQRDEGARGNIWEDYVYGLLEGKLSGDDGPDILSIPVETVADAVNTGVSAQTGEETYDRVITAYMRKKDESRISRETFDKFFSFIERLRPEIKRQFLARTGARLSEDIGKVENVISEMSPESFQKVAELFTEHDSFIPVNMKNLIDKLASIKQTKTSYFDFFYQQSAVLDDIELGDEVIQLFGEDHFHSYVSREYQKELEQMLAAKTIDRSSFSAFNKECAEEAIDSAVLDIMLELLYTDFITSEDYLKIITRLSDFMHVFLDTGRFEEILEAYNTLSSHGLSGKFRHEASSTVEYFFHSPDFVTRLVDAFRLWGRRERDGAIRLAKALRRSLIDPLLDALAEEQDPSMRKFFLSVLEAIGSDVVPHAVKRLSDTRWYVIRNMLCLIRDCNGRKEVDRVRTFVKHQNADLRMEALRTLLHFRAPDAVLFLRSFLQSEEPGIRRGAIKLAGNFRVLDAVPHLIRMVEKRDLFGTEAFHKIDCVKALGEIGDGRAINSLLKIYNAKSLLYRGTLEELKVEIFKNLHNYPFDQVKRLIDLGMRSKNEEIRTLSQNSLLAFRTPEKEGRDA
jgi:hypothetical protein